MAEPIVISGGSFDNLEAMPIAPDWIRRGDPVARGKLLVTTPDRLSYIMSWECTPGEFEWHFRLAEGTAWFVEGEAFIGIGGTAERRVGAGDIIVFAAGSSAVWRITRPVRKIAVLRKRLPRPMGLAVRAWNKMLRGAQIVPMQPAGDAARF